MDTRGYARETISCFLDFQLQNSMLRFQAASKKCRTRRPGTMLGVAARAIPPLFLQLGPLNAAVATTRRRCCRSHSAYLPIALPLPMQLSATVPWLRSVSLLEMFSPWLRVPQPSLLPTVRLELRRLMATLLPPPLPPQPDCLRGSMPESIIEDYL